MTKKTGLPLCNPPVDLAEAEEEYDELDDGETAVAWASTTAEPVYTANGTYIDLKVKAIWSGKSVDERTGMVPPTPVDLYLHLIKERNKYQCLLEWTTKCTLCNGLGQRATKRSGETERCKGNCVPLRYEDGHPMDFVIVKKNTVHGKYRLGGSASSKHKLMWKSDDKKIDITFEIQGDKTVAGYIAKFIKCLANMVNGRLRLMQRHVPDLNFADAFFRGNIIVSMRITGKKGRFLNTEQARLRFFRKKEERVDCYRVNTNEMVSRKSLGAKKSRNNLLGAQVLVAFNNGELNYYDALSGTNTKAHTDMVEDETYKHFLEIFRKMLKGKRRRLQETGSADRPIHRLLEEIYDTSDNI